MAWPLLGGRLYGEDLQVAWQVGNLEPSGSHHGESGQHYLGEQFISMRRITRWVVTIEHRKHRLPTGPLTLLVGHILAGGGPCLSYTERLMQGYLANRDNQVDHDWDS